MSDVERPEAPRLRAFQDGKNPFGNGKELATVSSWQGLISVEQQRAIAEVQARMIMARQMPRDPGRAVDQIIRDCARESLAAKALYSYARGGQDITGPSIRLAEAVAQRWGNLASGIKELSRGPSYSECVAYAWDLESGYYDERQFQVRHWRDTKQGGHPLKEERDIYEIIFNLGQRRKRAVLLAVIPGDVIEMAIQECERTIHANADTSPDAVLKMVEAFDRMGVTRQMLEKRIQRRMEAIRPAHIVQLSKIYASLTDEMSAASDWFEPETGASATWNAVETQHAAATASAVQPRQTTRKAAAKEAPASPVAPSAADVQKAQDRDRATAQRSKDAPDHLDEIPTDRWEGEAAGRPLIDSTLATAPVSRAEAEREPAVAAPAFEAMLLDRNGDPMSPIVYSDPLVFVRVFTEAVMVDLDDWDALWEQNADGIQDAKGASIEASHLLDGLMSVGPEHKHVEEAGILAYDPPRAIVVEVKMDRGKQMNALHLKEFKVEVDALTLLTYQDFVALNMAELRKIPASFRALCIKAVREQCKTLGVDAPAELLGLIAPASQDPVSPAPTAAASPSDADDIRSQQNLIADMLSCTSEDQLVEFQNGMAVKGFASRMTRSNKAAMIEPLRDAFMAQREKLRAHKAATEHREDDAKIQQGDA
jgi:hypothetical protein